MNKQDAYMEKSELISLVQIPVIEERLLDVKARVDKRVADAVALVCTEETVQSVKATRSDLNKEFGELEDLRKAVKAAVLDPYNRFESVYRECVSNAYKSADADLKQKISDVETGMKRECEAVLREYYTELCAAHHIDFVPFERSGVVVSLSDAKAKTQPPKKLREQLSQFVAKVEQDVALISGMDDTDEIMEAYHKSLDAAVAIGIVQERHRRIEEAKAARAAREEAQSREAEAVKKVEAFAPPVAAAPVEAPKVVTVSFKVTDTVDRLKLLKHFLISNGYKYE